MTAPTQTPVTEKPDPSEVIAEFMTHKTGCLWATPLPTGEPHFWHCTCGRDSAEHLLDARLTLAANIATAYREMATDHHAKHHPHIPFSKCQADPCNHARQLLEKWEAGQ